MHSGNSFQMRFSCSSGNHFILEIPFKWDFSCSSGNHPLIDWLRCFCVVSWVALIKKKWPAGSEFHPFHQTLKFKMTKITKSLAPESNQVLQNYVKTDWSQLKKNPMNSANLTIAQMLAQKNPPIHSKTWTDWFLPRWALAIEHKQPELKQLIDALAEIEKLDPKRPKRDNERLKPMHMALHDKSPPTQLAAPDTPRVLKWKRSSEATKTRRRTCLRRGYAHIQQLPKLRKSDGRASEATHIPLRSGQNRPILERVRSKSNISYCLCQCSVASYPGAAEVAGFVSTGCSAPSQTLAQPIL